ncbi:enteropeptidase-like [Anopheles maculipalpis]|uniref:enteropeptidase-like n=1 Tax=Anopheles maculipalpis TaxID=1496333 RepID=UPI002158FAAB|nr:enteropeptidase-like [Anopheles maculipalpis]
MQFFVVFVVIGVAAVSAIESDEQQFLSAISVDLTEDAKANSNQLATDGYTTFPGQFPHHARLFINANSVSSGSLITPNYILTRAYFLDYSIKWTDKAEGYAILGVPNGANEQRINFTESGMLIHPLFNHELNDIAMIRLDHPATFNKYVQPIRLPRLSDTRTYEKMEGTNVGISRYTSNQILSNNACNQLHPVRSIDAQHICTNAYVGGDFCGRSHGSGLIIEDENGPVLVGVTCIIYICSLNYPTAYARVSNFRDWIAANSDYVFDL